MIGFEGIGGRHYGDRGRIGHPPFHARGGGIGRARLGGHPFQHQGHPGVGDGGSRRGGVGMHHGVIGNRGRGGPGPRPQPPGRGGGGGRPQPSGRTSPGRGRR